MEKLLVFFKPLTKQEVKKFFLVLMFSSSTPFQTLVSDYYTVSSFLERSIQTENMQKLVKTVLSVNRDLHAVLQKLPFTIISLDLNGKLVNQYNLGLH